MATLSIGGRQVSGAGEFEVLNPATGQAAGSAPECSRAQLDEAVDAAARAFVAWKRDEPARRAALEQCSDLIKANAETLARLITLEQGKPLAKATREVMGAAAWFRYTASLTIPTEVARDDAQMRIEVRRRPIGVVGAITPWNYPVILAAWKIAPALRAGNTVVLKPSPFTPLATLKLGEILQSALPAGVLNVVCGGDELGKAITSHPGIRKISFTGSTCAGKHVAQSAAADLRRITLELGGNDAAIVLDDVDPASIAPKIFWAAFDNTGQICAAIKRVYAHERVFPDLVGELARIARSVRVGDGMFPETEMGPLSNAPQLERVVELVEDARRNGGEIVTGGARIESPGYFFAPTIVTGLGSHVRLVAEEQFGPALPCMSYSDVDEAIALANDSPFGLSGSIWSADTQRAVELAPQLECGTVWINQHMTIVPDAPISGLKSSGIGVENGPWGLLAMTEMQTVEIPR